MLHLVLAQPLVRAIHVADNDGDVLKPSVVAAGIGRSRSSSRREEFREFDVLFTEAHPCRSHPKTKHAEEVLVPLAVYLGLRDLLKIQHGGVELDGTIEIRNRESDRVDSFDKWVRSG